MREGWVSGASRGSCPWAHGGGAHSNRQCRAVRECRSSVSPRRLHDGIANYSPDGEKRLRPSPIQTRANYVRGNGVPQDYRETLRWYRKAADQGNASAQRNLGVMFGEGLGVPQDYAEGFAGQPSRTMLPHRRTLASCMTLAMA